MQGGSAAHSGRRRRRWWQRWQINLLLAACFSTDEGWPAPGGALRLQCDPGRGTRHGLREPRQEHKGVPPSAAARCAAAVARRRRHPPAVTAAAAVTITGAATRPLPADVPVPKTAAVPHVLKAPAGVRAPPRSDPYHWLRDDARNNSAVLSHLQEENAYAEAVLRPSLPLQQRLREEMQARVPRDESSLPQRVGRHWYYSRHSIGKQYRRFCRRRIDDPAALPTEHDVMNLAQPEEVLLDVNELAGVGGGGGDSTRCRPVWAQQPWQAWHPNARAGLCCPLQASTAFLIWWAPFCRRMSNCSRLAPTQRAARSTLCACTT